MFETQELAAKPQLLRHHQAKLSEPGVHRFCAAWDAHDSGYVFVYIHDTEVALVPKDVWTIRPRGEWPPLLNIGVPEWFWTRTPWSTGGARNARLDGAPSPVEPPS